MCVHFKDYVTQTGKKQKTPLPKRFLSLSLPLYQIRDDRYVISGMEASENTVENTTVSTA